MDVIRKKSTSRKVMRYGLLTLAVVGVMATAAVSLNSLEPALPVIDQSTVILDTVQRGGLVKQILGSGTLVPVNVTWVTADVGGQVVQVHVEPGIEVTPETVILTLHDPQIERAVREAKRSLESAKADLQRFELQQESLRLDNKVALATARANFEEARQQTEMDEVLARRGLKSPRQWQFSRDRAERSRMLYEVQLARSKNILQTQDIQHGERKAAIERVQDLLDERQEQVASLVVRAGTSGILQQLGQPGAILEVGRHVAEGAVVAKISDPSRLKAVLSISQVQAQDVVVGQPAIIDTRSGLIQGRVSRIDVAVQNDRVAVEVELIDELPKSARPDLSVEGLIDVARLDDVLYVRKPVYSQEGARLQLLRLHPDDRMLLRTMVEFGAATMHMIEVVAGLEEGDQIVISDTTRWRDFDQIQLK